MKHTDNCGRTGSSKAHAGCKLDCKCRCHNALLCAAQKVVAAWESGDLALAVSRLADEVKAVEAATE